MRKVCRVWFLVNPAEPTYLDDSIKQRVYLGSKDYLLCYNGEMESLNVCMRTMVVNLNWEEDGQNNDELGTDLHLLIWLCLHLFMMT